MRKENKRIVELRSCKTHLGVNLIHPLNRQVQTKSFLLKILKYSFHSFNEWKFR